MLRNPAGFAFNDLSIEDSVEQTRFTVVDMPHHCHDWRTLGRMIA